jgi:RNA polymerase sigma-70 factor (ECF subfamily)
VTPSVTPALVAETSAFPVDTSARARFERIFAEHYGRVWRVLRRLGLAEAMADDAAQESFVVLAGKLGDVEAGEELPYLLVVARKIAANARRRAAHQVLVDQAPPVPSPHQRVESRERLALLDRWLEEMGEELREAFILFEIEGLTRKEAAAAMEVPDGTAASRHRRAREQFLQLLAREQEP